MCDDDHLVNSIFHIHLQAFILNDVDISPEPKTLLFDKHVKYIEDHGKDRDEYVGYLMESM